MGKAHAHGMNLSEPTAASRRMPRRSAIRLALACLGLTACGAASASSASYGAKVQFRKGATVRFPDFDVTYVGMRKETSKVYPRGFTYEDFTVSRGGNSQKVSWSSGTGLIAPRSFEHGGRKFVLNLVYASGVGRLAQDQMVITPY